MPNDLSDRLEPFFDDVDAQILQIGALGRHDLKGKRLPDSEPGFLQTKAVGFFEDAGLLLKTLWYHRSRIETLDAEYSELVQAPSTDPGVGYSVWYTRLSDDRWSYYPFFEAMELAALLGAARATVETFCQGTGMLFKNVPVNLARLLRVLVEAEKREPRAATLAAFAARAERALSGIVVDPRKNGKKALRDLMQHRERAPIHFTIGPAGSSSGALVRRDNPALIRLPNWRVTAIVDTTWFRVRELMAASLPVVVEILEHRRAVAAKGSAS